MLELSENKGVKIIFSDYDNENWTKKIVKETKNQFSSCNEIMD